MTNTSMRNQLATAVPVTVATILLLAGCSTGQSTATAAPGAAAGSGGRRGGSFSFPGAYGRIAEVSGRTLQVQSTTQQTAVTYSGSTRFTIATSAKRSVVAKGVCVRVLSDPTATPAASLVTASSVSISAPVNGSCTTVRPGAAARGNRNAAGQPPAGSTPRYGAGGGVGRGRPVAGLVAAVSRTGFTVTETTAPGATPSTPVTVTTTSTTTYTEQKVATAKAVEVGLCAVARGTSDSTGTIAATAIALSPQTNGTCANPNG